MSNIKPESIEIFESFVNSIKQEVDATRISSDNKKDFTRLITRANRIFITGTGTSLPNALFLEELLSNQTNKPIKFLNTGKMFRILKSLQADDLFIIISHGLNRADSLISYEFAKNKCMTIAITGNTSLESKDNNLVINVPPVKEKIFCRPVSPITVMLVIDYLLLNKPPTLPKRLNFKEDLIKWLDPKKQIIILYTSGVHIAAQLWGIVLREGAGLNVSIKDVENYAHGYYGTDTKDLSNRQFIILKDDSPLDSRDYDRAKSLYGIDNFNSFVITAPKETGNISLYIEVAHLVLAIIKITKYDMNNPIGMEENRSYHEYEHYKDYI